jgi:hypothetical protein
VRATFQTGDPIASALILPDKCGQIFKMIFLENLPTPSKIQVIPSVGVPVAKQQKLEYV